MDLTRCYKTFVLCLKLTRVTVTRVHDTVHCCRTQCSTEQLWKSALVFSKATEIKKTRKQDCLLIEGWPPVNSWGLFNKPMNIHAVHVGGFRVCIIRHRYDAWNFPLPCVAQHPSVNQWARCPGSCCHAFALAQGWQNHISCSNLDPDPMTFIYELDLFLVKM